MSTSISIFISFFFIIFQIHGSWSSFKISTQEMDILTTKTKSFCGLIMHIESPETYQVLTSTEGGHDRKDLAPVILQSYNSTMKNQKWEVNGQGSCQDDIQYRSFSFRPLLHCHNNFSLEHEKTSFQSTEFIIQSVQCWTLVNVSKSGAKDTRHLIVNRSDRSNEEMLCLERFGDIVGTARCNRENENQLWKIHENL